MGEMVSAPATFHNSPAISNVFKVSATLQSAIFRYLGFLHSQIDLFESFLLQKKSEKNIISVKRYRGQKILSC